MKTKLLLLVFAVVFTNVNLQAADFTVDGIAYTITSTTAPYTVAVGSKSPIYTGTVTIPASVSYNSINYSVTAIGNGAFYNCQYLFSVTIPNSVTSIGDSAFYYCMHLNSVTIPNSVTSIGDQAFLNCQGLTSVTIPNSVTSIGDNAFSHCSVLMSITIPNSVTTIGIGTFALCVSLTSLTIPNSITSIGDYAYYQCTGLSSITIPGSVTSIGVYAFEACYGLTSLTIPNSVTSIGDYSFYGCYGLTSVSIGSSVTSIGATAFASCTGLTSVTIPNSVTSIGAGAFAHCTGLTSATIPNSVTYLGSQAFQDCTGLTSVSIGNSVATIRQSVFEGCTGLTSVTIPNSVTSIGFYAFKGCTGLISVVIPNSVTSIGEQAFCNCTGLTSIYADNPTPILLISVVFLNVNKTTCTLYVPIGSKSLYAAAPVWKDFTNIVEHSVGVDPVAKILNGQFDNGTQDWQLSTYATGAAATFKVDANSVISGTNSCAVTISQITGTDWHIQMWQGLNIYPGHKYTITFKAKASANRSIILALQKAVSPNTTYLYKSHNLTTQVQTFTDEVTITTTDQAKLQFYFGSSTASVWIDDITIVDTDLTTGIDEPLPANGNISVLQNYPNPFTSATTIKYKVTEPGFVSIKVFNAIGTEITTLVYEKKPAGEYSVDWNAVGLTSGIYFCRLQNGSSLEVKKMILQK